MQLLHVVPEVVPEQEAAAPDSKRGYANNYDGRTPDRYDSVNPTYRQGPPDLQIYQNRGGQLQQTGRSYLDYYKDPLGRW